MPAPINAVGRTYGRLIVLEKAPSRRYNGGKPRVMWRCICSCGTYVDVHTAKLQNGHTQSCGCLQRERTGNTARTHGLRHTREYESWASMKSRCLNPSSVGYHKWGGRGISICKEWINSFEQFLSDMGPRPKGTTIDRINNNGNYEPSNCRWATAKEQANNLRTTRFFEADGIRDTVSGWCDRLGIERHMIENGLRRGKTFQQLYERFSDPSRIIQ